MATMQRVAILLALLAAPLLGQPTQQWGSWTIGPGAFGSREWRPPVADEASLPADGNRLGDIRLAVSEGTLWRWDGAEWDLVETAGGGSAYWRDPDDCEIGGTYLDLGGNGSWVYGVEGLGGSCATQYWTPAGLALTQGGTIAAQVEDDGMGGAQLSITTPTTVHSDLVVTGSGDYGAGLSVTGGIYADAVEIDGSPVLTDISGQTIGDLSDVSETGAAAGEALISDGAGSWSPSAAAVCLIDGTNCPASSAAFSAITSGTNTSAAMQVGTGASLKVAASSTGKIDASGIDADGDGVRNVRMNSTTLEFDPDDDAVAEVTISNAGNITTAGSVDAGAMSIGNESLLNGIGATGGLGLNLAANPDAGIRFAPRRISLGINTEVSVAVTVDAAERSTILFCDRTGDCSRTTAAINYTSGLRIDGGGLWVTDASISSPSSAPIEVGVLRLTPRDTAPATCTAYRDLYSDTSGALCWCSATDTWSVLTGGGSCV